LRGEEEVVDGGLIKRLRDWVTMLRLLVGRS
jgi:hypothetical protein